MRGKASGFDSVIAVFGITPAYAGKRVLCGTSGNLNLDHPRLCGEKFEQRGKKLCRVGSPPPMRGKAACTDQTQRADRITPAYAGKSLPLFLVRSTR